MRIFHSPESDPMILDSLSGMNTIYNRLCTFVNGPDGSISLRADTDGSPDPYGRFLKGIIIEKTNGPINLSLGADDMLHLVGAPSNFALYFEYFKFTGNQDPDHHHPEFVLENGELRKNYMVPGSMYLIIEIDTNYIEELKGS